MIHQCVGEPEIDKVQLEKNYADSLKRLTLRYRSGVISEREYNSLLDWERKNFESGGRLYAERLAKALTPNPKWLDSEINVSETKIESCY